MKHQIINTHKPSNWNIVRDRYIEVSTIDIDKTGFFHYEVGEWENTNCIE